jgi:hypothetical protein
MPLFVSVAQLYSIVYHIWQGGFKRLFLQYRYSVAGHELNSSVDTVEKLDNLNA